MIPVHGFAPYFFALFPGLGHFYLQCHTKAVLYGLPFWFVVVLFFIILNGPGDHRGLPFLFFGDVILWAICFVDMLSTIDRLKASYMHMPDRAAGFATPPPPPEGMDGRFTGQLPYGEPFDPERSKLMTMAIVPGLGHFHLGLMQRGMSTMALFFGIIVFILFIASMTSGSFLAFLFALPIIWFYTLFDVLNLYKRKKIGETLTDRSLFDDFYLNGESNRRNRTVATLLAIFPGAGHLYLGIQRRGIQLMIGFLVSLYLLDVLRLSFFLFLIPIFWFFSFFDALQIISRFEKEEPKDVPVVNSVFHYRRWIGFALIFMGVYFVVYRIAPEFLSLLFRDNLEQIWHIYSLIRNYMEVGIVSLLLIVAGIFLLFRRKKSTPAPILSDKEQ
jgi:hypothetical protein